MKSLPAKLYLAISGQSEGEEERMIVGQLNPALTFTGKQEARQLARALQWEPLSAIYASPLTRAIETASPIAELHRLPILICDRLKAQHYGDLEGKIIHECDVTESKRWSKRPINPAHHRVHRGETFFELISRVWVCLEKIYDREPGGTVLIVAHRSTNQAILSYLMNWPPEKAACLKLQRHFLYEIIPGESIQMNSILLAEKNCGDCYEGFII